MTTTEFEPLPRRALSVFTRATSCGVVALGALIFMGWVLGVREMTGIVPGLYPMKANTALGMILAGAALLLVANEGAALWRKRAARICAFVVTLLGMLTLIEYLSGVDLGIDQWLVRDLTAVAHPGRMGFNTACVFALVGEALLLLSERGPKAALLSQGMMLAGLFIALAALVGHAYHVAFLMRFSSQAQMAALTALSFIVLCAGMLTSRPRRPLMALVLSTGEGGVLTRLVWPQAIVLLLLLGWLVLLGERAKLYGTAFGMAMMVLTTIALFSLLIWGAAAALERRWRDGARLNLFNRELVATRELEEVTAAVCRVARELLKADGATFILHEGDQVYYANENAVSPLWKGQRFPINSCISGWSIIERQPAVIGDIYADDRIPHDAYRTTFVKSLAMMPVGPGQPVAAIGAYWAKHHRAGSYEIELLKSVAAAADLALTHVRSYDLMRRAREQAEAANRLKDEFLATVSHELRTPLNHMLGWLVILRGGRLAPDQAAEALATVERNARAQNRLIEDLLDMSRIISGSLHLELRPVEIGEVVTAAIASARPAAETKGVRLRIVDCGLRIEESGPTTERENYKAKAESTIPTPQSTIHNPHSAFKVLGDADRLQQVIWNLLSNAIKFTPEGGSILVRLARQARFALEGECVEVSVSDTGAGIEPEFLPYVFDRFRQADGSPKRRFGGLGLGLAIVRHLIELHSGEVHAESAGPGRGSTFTVRLPLAELQATWHSGQAVASTDWSTAAMAAAPRLDGVRALVVDDETDAQTVITAILTGGGAQVRTAASAMEAMGILAEWPPDIILSDIGMPDEDGYEFIRRVRVWEAKRNGNGHRQIPAAALTAYARAADRIKALTAGYQSHLPKPVEPVELLAVVASLVRKPGNE